MSANAKVDEVDHARQNAQGWLESIQGMVAGLDRDSAAELFANTLSAEQCLALIPLDPDNVSHDPERDYESAYPNVTTGASLEMLREEVARLISSEEIEVDGFEFNEETARETIQESVLSVEVRSDWYSPGASEDDDSRKPCEFNILLTTGGPALRLIGELDEYGQPTRAWLEYQDWGTPWTHYYVKGAGAVLLQFAGCFYFGE